MEGILEVGRILIKMWASPLHIYKDAKTQCSLELLEIVEYVSMQEGK